MRDPFERTVAHTIERCGMFAADRAVLVAVSGGPDSVALASSLARIGPANRLVLAHGNHRLRGAGSDRDARFVAELARRLSLEVRVFDCTVPPGPNLEERARQERYRQLRRVARQGGLERIATGHTRDDQAETFLLRLLRGTGTTGLGGIEPARADGVVRPLLDSTREGVLAYLERRGLPYRVDPTNDDPRFLRNRVRHRVLPLLEREFGPAVRDRIARTADLARDDERGLSLEARERAVRATREGALSRRSVARADPALGRRIVREWLRLERGDLRRLTAAHVESVVRSAVTGRTGTVLCLPGGRVRVESDRLRWAVAPREVAPSVVPLRPGESISFGPWWIAAEAEARCTGIPPGPWSVVIDRDRIDAGSLAVRGVRPGDRIRPFGLGGTKKLQDVFVDGKVPREERRQWPVVTAGNDVLWLPGLVRSDAAPVTAATDRTIRLQVRRPAR